jgi:MFS transporter, DHA1 family, tetracycline resistance protein
MKNNSVNEKTMAFGLIFSTLLIDVAAMGMLIPVLPELIRGFVGGDFGRAAQLAGLVAALSAGLSFACAPVLGGLSDRFGRKPLLLLGMVGPAITYLGLAGATDVSWYVIGFCITGILGAIHSTTNAYVADITPFENRAARYGMMGAAFGLGFIVGPLAGGLLSGLGLRVPFYVAGGLTLLNLALCLFFLPESLDNAKRRVFTWRQANPLASLGLLRRSPLLTAIAGSLFLSNLANHGLYSTWVFSTTLRFGWSSVTTGIVFTLIGVCTALAQGLLVGPIVKRLGERRSILLGLTVSMSAFLAYALAPQGWMIYLIIALSSFGAVDEPASQALVSSSVGEDEQGAVQGALASLISLTAVFGPLLSTSMFNHFVSENAPIYFPGAPFALGAFLIACALLLAWRFVRPSNRGVALKHSSVAVQPAGD